MRARRRKVAGGPRGAVMAEVLGASRSVMVGAFRLMEIAEEEIARVGDRDGFFLVLTPPPGFSMLDERLYRSHARELADRVASGGDTTEGTDAEVLAAYLRASLDAPLTSTAAAVVEELWERVFPGTGILGGERTREAWAGQVEEDAGAVRRRLRSPSRRLR